MSYITSIGTANPPHKFSQKQIAEFMIKAMSLQGDEAEQLRILYRASGIESRYSALPDYGLTDQFQFYPNSEDFEPFPSTKDRLEYFRSAALHLSMQAVHNCVAQVSPFNLEQVTHLVIVSCTGMFAPGLDIELINSLSLAPTVKRTSINFMGCYAAFNGLRIADAFCKQQPNAKVLVVCTELCSLHFQKIKNEDNILANALFADGAAAVLIENSPNNNISLIVENSFCDLIPDGRDDMAWSIGDTGFEMKLSSYVPHAIQKGIKRLVQSLLSINNLDLSHISHFAIHPGGKKILEAIERELGLSKHDNRFSYDIMRNYGNMSSPTVLFVLHEIVKSMTLEDNGKKILGLGFGPGLTMESLILTVNSN